MARESVEAPHDIIYPSTIPFLLLHLAAAGVFLSGITLQALWLCAALYGMRMFAIGAAYHRYFSHRAFSTGRPFQFALAVLAQSTAQRGVLWWAAMHRHHHVHADTKEDAHSPMQHGFLYAHLGWIFDRRYESTDWAKVADFSRFPELRWLNRFETVPAVGLAAISYVVAGWSGLVVGFVWSTLMLYHATFAINSLAHTHGSKRFLTGDESRNNLWLALLTFGEGWHNNHHAFQSAARQGFHWWEIDLTFYGLKGLAAAGLVWDLKAPPARLLGGEEGRLTQKVRERVALRLARSFPIENIIGAAKSDTAVWRDAERFIASSLLNYGDSFPPMFPSDRDIRARALVMFVDTSHTDEIVVRAQALIADALADGLAICGNRRCNAGARCI